MQISLNFRNPQSPLLRHIWLIFSKEGDFFGEFKALYMRHNAPPFEKGRLGGIVLKKLSSM